MNNGKYFAKIISFLNWLDNEIKLNYLTLNIEYSVEHFFEVEIKEANLSANEDESQNYFKFYHKKSPNLKCTYECLIGYYNEFAKKMKYKLFINDKD
jgi:hypothetical protein